jgi:hypoxanthine phosphoribosyltransferase
MDLTSVALSSLLLILFSSMGITFATYIYVDAISTKNKRDREEGKGKSLNKPSWESKNHADVKKITQAKEVESDGVLPASSTILGVISLEYHAREYDPEYIVGVNRGGWLLSTYLAHRLDISRSNLLRFDADRDEIIDNIDSLDCIDNASKRIKVLLVDDISRTGNSVDKCIDFLKKKSSSIDIYVEVLVVCNRQTKQTDHKKTDNSINYYPYWTQNKDIQLPWSSDDRKREARKIINSQEKVVQLGSRDSLETKVPILRIADSETTDGGGIDISTSDMETVMNLLKNFSYFEYVK